MSTLSKWVVDQILQENNVIAIYPGRFQPFGLHHYNTYKWLEEQFGKDNTFVATSNKTKNPSSPFSFEEKKQIIESYGKINTKLVKNPYRCDEILENYDKPTLSVVFLVGEKDKERLSGKFFHEWKGEAKIPITEGAYVITGPHRQDVVDDLELSGTLIREILGSPRQNKRDLFKEIFGHTKPKIYNLVVDKLEEVYETKELINEFIEKTNLVSKILKEQNVTSPNNLGLDVDDGPGFLWGDVSSYKQWNDKLAKQLGQEVVDWIIDSELINFRDFLSSPKDDFESGEGDDRDAWISGGVTPPSWFASGISGVDSIGHTIDSVKAQEIYKDWVKHIKGISKSIGWEFVNFLGENITIPVKVGDTILTGKFKNKKTVVKSIDKNEKGDITINGKSVLRFRVPEDIDEGIKDTFKKFYDKIKEPVSREYKETKELFKLLFDIIFKGYSPSQSDKKFMRGQTIDLGKIATLGALQVIPGSSIVTPLLIKLGKMYGFNVLPQKRLEEITRQELLQVSKHRNESNYPIKLVKFNRPLKRLVFEVGEYTCQVQLENFPVISRLKGDITEKVKLALDDDIKVSCSCKDFQFNGPRYNTFQTDAGIYKETRPPEVRDPENENFLCKHLKQLLEKIQKKVPK